jgi:ligand-binding sensor domain-containing protein
VRSIVILLLISAALTAKAQYSIGSWKDHLPYNNAFSIFHYNNNIYLATENGLFIKETADNSIRKLNKTNGLSDVGITAVENNENQLVIGYLNGNIDVIEKTDIHNIPLLKNEAILGEKKINNININNEIAYLSCSFGILEVNLPQKEISNTYWLNASQSLAVNEIAFFQNQLFAATDSGLYFAHQNDNLIDFHSWNVKSFTAGKKINALAAKDSTLFYQTADSLYSYPERFEAIAIANSSIITLAQEKLYLLSPTVAYEIRLDGELVEVYNSNELAYVRDLLILNDTSYFADFSKGLVTNIGEEWSHDYPKGPHSINAYSIAVNENYLFIATGGIDAWNNAKVNMGTLWSDYYDWNRLSGEYLGAKDIVDVKINPTNEKEIVLSTWNEGLIELGWSESNQRFEKQQQYTHLNTNSHLNTLSTDTSSSIYGWIRVKSIAYDEEGNLWGANSQVNNPLFVKKNNGEWASFGFSSVNTTNVHLGNFLIDDVGQKWVIVPQGIGLVVYNDNNTIDNVNDDQDKVISGALGSGNLPSTSIYCMAKDRNGEIWVGSNKGVAVFFNPENIFNGGDYDAQQILVEVDGYIEYLLTNETVTTIAVDGANRKWLGTQNAGLFLVSEDGTEQIHHFTADNSPLLSNNIIDVKINPSSGEVYIATAKGLVSYFSDATEGSLTHENVIVYPNPVRPEYNGTIAIKGLVQDAYVKITDLNGVLVHETQALGSQAVWDGKNGYGDRVQTGVYLVFSTNATGTETNVAKILFVH